MKRSMMQAYVTGSKNAVALYQRAFGAELISSYPKEDGSFYHSELDIEGEVLAVAERTAEEGAATTGNVMQFCLHYGEGREDAVRKAYDILKDGAEIKVPLAPCEFSPLMADLIDAYGIRWCLFV